MTDFGCILIHRSWGEYLAEQDFSHWALGKVKEAVTWSQVDDSLMISEPKKRQGRVEFEVGGDLRKL